VGRTREEWIRHVSLWVPDKDQTATRVFIAATICAMLDRARRRKGKTHELHTRVDGDAGDSVVWLGSTGEGLPESQDADEGEGACVEDDDRVCGWV
jgi:hypothetical protein